MNDMTPAPLGHNMPPAPIGPYMPEDLEAKIADYTDAAGAWLDLKELTTQEQAEKAADFIKGGKAVEKLVDDERKRQKRPHDDAGKAVQDFFAPQVSRVKIAHERVSSMQTKWLQAERQRKEAQRIEDERIAREKAAQIAREKAAAEARNDVAGIAEAEAAEKAANKEIKAATKAVTARAESATGAGRAMSLRTVWHAEIENINHAFVHFRDHPEVAELLTRLGTAEVRGQKGEKTAPQGFKIRSEEKAA